MLWCTACMDYTSIARLALVNNAHAPTGRAQAYFTYDHIPLQLMFLLSKRTLTWTMHEQDFSNTWTLFLMLLTKHGLAFPLGLHDAVKSLRQSINPDYLNTDYRDAFHKPAYPGDSSLTTGYSDKPIDFDALRHPTELPQQGFPLLRSAHQPPQPRHLP